ncbi:hypothetical protein C3486_28220 [Streptomyces sp. Ru73]|uniref:DUF1266 domain-containing protein n=1 Tax=Streptomyces sp. Ru73 TaxID=2080748 RepID=UPI000CDCEAD7|nr:DUF1266 domain-containing protein [Streptomyces sp. Ru73]POX37478.1 hypothetical protein C3486_28220 [Streptomyces sp. Ru73]
MAIPHTGPAGDPATDEADRWVPPTAVEHALLAAKSRGDWWTYLKVLMTEELFTVLFKEEYDRLGDDAATLLLGDPADGQCVPLYTRGLLPRRDDLVVCKLRFPIGRTETADGTPAGVVVNPGSPCSARIPYDAKKYREWGRLERRIQRRGHDDDELLTKHTGPLTGPLAHGLACGGHLAVHNQVLWNEVGEVYDDYPGDVECLRDSWGVTDREGWQEQLTYLLRGENSPPHPEFALRVRNALLAERPGRPVDPEEWRGLAVADVRERGGDERDAAAVREAVGRILRYEARFRADGLLTPDGPGSVVTSALAYDYGRAVNFARWGLGARYAGQEETEAAVVRAGELSRAAYSSWAGFSAGYVLGRALRFDEESFGHMYASALSPHRILMGHPESPWRAIPFSSP